MKSSFCIDLQRFMLIPTKFPLSHSYVIDFQRGLGEVAYSKKDWTLTRALYHQSIQNYKKEIEEDLYEW